MITAIISKILLAMSLIAFGLMMALGNRIGCGIYEHTQKFVSSKHMAWKERRAERKFDRSQVMTEITDTVLNSQSSPDFIQIKPQVNMG